MAVNKIIKTKLPPADLRTDNNWIEKNDNLINTVPRDAVTKGIAGDTEHL